MVTKVAGRRDSFFSTRLTSSTDSLAAPSPITDAAASRPTKADAHRVREMTIASTGSPDGRPCTATASPWCTAEPRASGVAARATCLRIGRPRARPTGRRPPASGARGHATAHEAALYCACGAANSEAARLADDASKHRIDCGGAGGCARLVDAAEVLRRRASLWTVLVEHAELAPTAQLGNLVAKFVGKSTCRSRTAEATANPDCSRTLVLSTSFAAPSCSIRRGARSRRRSSTPRCASAKPSGCSARPSTTRSRCRRSSSSASSSATHPTTRSPR